MRITEAPGSRVSFLSGISLLRYVNSGAGIAGYRFYLIKPTEDETKHPKVEPSSEWVFISAQIIADVITTDLFEIKTFLIKIITKP